MIKKRRLKRPNKLLFFQAFSTIAFLALIGLVLPAPTHGLEGASSVDEALPEITTLSEPGRASVRVDATLKRKPLRRENLPDAGQVDLGATGVPELFGNRARKVPQKPLHTVITSHVIPHLIVVKFVVHVKC